MSDPGETTHRGVRWRRDTDGGISFYDEDGGRWVPWARGVDAPPRPPGWAPRGVRPPRPGWRTPWRMVPLGVTVVVVIIAVIQVLRPTSTQEQKEAAASAALLGKCLAQHGTAAGHPKFSTAPVACGSSQAAVRVVQVVPTAPGSPACPAVATTFRLDYPGVRYPHLLCLEPVPRNR